MRVPFTKMQGAGNDFVVLDETRGPLGLSPAQIRFLADRHFGVGADQVLTVRPSPGPGLDFEYVIHNADGGEVEHCGNGARCFVRYVHDKGLSTRNPLRVKVRHGVLELLSLPDGRVTVDMGAPVFELPRIPFQPDGLQPVPQGNWQQWPLDIAPAGQPLHVPATLMQRPTPPPLLPICKKVASGGPTSCNTSTNTVSAARTLKPS